MLDRPTGMRLASFPLLLLALATQSLAAQERIIAYRHSLSWWLQLPWLVLRSWWQRIADR